MSKTRVIVETVLAGKSQTQTAAQYGISQAYVSQLLKRWREGGAEALEPRSRRPHTNPNQTPQVIRDRILQLRDQLTEAGADAGPATIRIYLAREGWPTPAEATIWRICKGSGRVADHPRKRPRSSFVRFEADLPNECWQADFTHWWLTDGRNAEILLFIDDHSRFIVSATVHTAVTGRHVLNAFRAACEVHGTPQSTLTDNGLVFTTRFVQGPNGFETELAKRGVEQKNGRPNHPQTQGKVERLNQTLKRFLAKQEPAATIKELLLQVTAFTDHYNHQRPHRSLEGRTPAEAYAARTKAEPTTRSAHFRVRDDVVDKFGKVSLRIAGQMHHIAMDAANARTPIRMLIHGMHVTIVAKETGEILRELDIDPETRYSPSGKPAGPPKGSPQRGGVKKGYKRVPKT